MTKKECETLETLEDHFTSHLPWKTIWSSRSVLKSNVLKRQFCVLSFADEKKKESSERTH
jgi:hypothetical protein